MSGELGAASIAEAAAKTCAAQSGDSEWTRRAIWLLDGDGRRSADTHLLRLDTPTFPGIDIYLKDESTHPTGSLKHRLARSLFLFGICNGDICEGTPLVEASSGSTAVSEAYFASLLGLAFHAVMPRRTSAEKVAAIEAHGGVCHYVDDAGAMYAAAEQLARDLKGHYLDQFTNAERVTDWRGNNNIAESIFEQMRSEPHPVPKWIVMSAGTGGTSATIGRYIRYSRRATKLSVVDVENSVFFDSFESGDRHMTRACSSRIEGIGRPRVEPSFIPHVIDRMMRVPDAASIGAMRVLSRKLRRRVGASTGTNFFGLLSIAEAMRAAGETGSLLTILCDDGQRYQNTYYDDAWLEREGLDFRPWETRIAALVGCR